MLTETSRPEEAARSDKSHGFAGIWLGLVLVAGCGTDPRPVPATLPRSPRADMAEVESVVDALVGLMRQRLLVMHDVARWKWNHGRPIADPVREQAVLTDIEEQAEVLQLDRDLARNFMAAQMEAGKLVQQADFERWTAEGRGEFAVVRDLATDLRPMIDELNTNLLDHLAKLEPRLVEEKERATIQDRAIQILQGDGIDDAVQATAIRPLLVQTPDQTVPVEP
ncbi:MAG TPA: gamma subclass chorismate mutase AroQ [Pirellulales bacterium]|nr:gamma subclass chorismate mutase AroQ [Pirellulales bacterium]